MSDVFKKALALLTGVPQTSDSSSQKPNKTLALDKLPLKLGKKRALKTLTERELIQLESQIGATIFGEVKPGHRREFFCLDEKTWIWHEEAVNPSTHKMIITTTRYEIQAQGILKVQEGARYTYLKGVELQNFHMAVQVYYEQVLRDIYKIDAKTGQRL